MEGIIGDIDIRIIRQPIPAGIKKHLIPPIVRLMTNRNVEV